MDFSWFNLSPSVWTSLNLWISTRNLLCRQWSHKEGNWPSKRIHSETTGFGDWSVRGDGNYTCWGFYGVFFFPLNLLCWCWCYCLFTGSVPYCSDANMGFICIISTIVINISLNLICRGVSAPILECLIIQLKLPQKLLKRQNSLI
jgi:hypothetical protein